MIKVGINGYGTIGSRVANAILLQDDMQLIGVTKHSPDYKSSILSQIHNLYATDDILKFEKQGIKVHGTVHDLIKKCDVIVDCAPKKQGANNKLIYDKYDIKVLFQGGEKDIIGKSFNSDCNFDDVKNEKYVRVVSCNTTALCRTLNQINKNFKIKKARVALVRRSRDIFSSKEGMLNAWQPEAAYPSHHSIDVNSILPDLKVTSLAGVAPMTLMHGHMVFIEFQQTPTIDQIKQALTSNPRIKIFNMGSGIVSTANIKDYAQTVGRDTGNLFEVGIFEESINADSDGEIGMHLAIDQQAIVIPETIDAIRAIMGISREDSVKRTNATLINPKINK